MTARTLVALLTTAIAVSHFYLLYPLPGEKIRSIRESEKSFVKSAPEQRKPSARGMNNVELDALEKSMWRSWYVALAIVTGGLLVGLLILRTRSPWWQIAALAYGFAYLTAYAIEVVLPLDKPFAEIMGFQIDNIRSLARLGEGGRLIMATHLLLAPILIAIVVAYSAFKLKAKSP